MTQEFRHVRTIALANKLGEGVRWDELSQCMWWTDIEGKRIFQSDLESSAPTMWQTPHRLASFALTDDPSVLLCAFDNTIALWKPSSGATCKLVQNAEVGTRFNDGRVDNKGRFWVGTMVEGANRKETGAIYQLDALGNWNKAFAPVQIANSICWNGTGRQMFFSDSARQIIWRAKTPHSYRLHPELFVELAQGEPDGAVTDIEDHLWVAIWGEGEVRRYKPDGALDTTLQVPQKQPSCIAFGGPKLNHLLISSAQVGLDPPGTDDGKLSIYISNYQGRPENRFSIQDISPVWQ